MPTNPNGPKCAHSVNHDFTSTFITMSFAGRRRGNKVKKGVQFTLMVVGTLLNVQCLAFNPNSLLQVPLELDVLPSLILSASRKSWPTKSPITLRQPMSRRVSGLSQSTLVSSSLCIRLTCLTNFHRTGGRRCPYCFDHSRYPWFW